MRQNFCQVMGYFVKKQIFYHKTLGFGFVFTTFIALSAPIVAHAR